MRVSTSQMFQVSLDAISASNAAVMQAQQAIASGTRVDAASQDIAAVRLSSQLLETQRQAGVFNANIDELDIRFSESDVSLASLADSLGHMAEVMVQARNGALDAGSLATFGMQLELDAEAVRAEMKRTDSQARPIYSYTSEEIDAALNAQLAKAAAASGAIAQGSAGSAADDLAAANQAIALWTARRDELAQTHPALAVRPGQTMNAQVSLDAETRSALRALGGGALAAAVTGNGVRASTARLGASEARAQLATAQAATPPDDALVLRLQARVVDATALEAAQASLAAEMARPAAERDGAAIAAANRTIDNDRQQLKAAQDQDLADAQSHIGALLADVQQARGSVGARWSVLSNYQDVNASFALAAQTALSRIQDTDVAASISDLSNYQAQLVAARAMFNKIQSAVSLFDLFR